MDRDGKRGRSALRNYGFVKVAAASPRLRLGDASVNAREILSLWRDADGQGALCVVFPELCLTGATCGDLFLREGFQASALETLHELRRAGASLRCAALVGLPLRAFGRLYNAMALVCQGRLLAIVPKDPIAGQERWFSRYDGVPSDWEGIPFGLRCVALPEATVGIAFDEADVFALSQEGAQLVLVPQALPARAGESPERAYAGVSRAARCTVALACAGPGESSGAGAYAGDCLILENGETLARGARFREEGQLILADVQGVSETPGTGLEPSRYRVQEHFSRALSRHPLFKDDPLFYEEVFQIQVAALKRRLRHIGTDKIVLALSGGLDSTAALLSAHEALREMGAPPDHLIAVSMPGLGTSPRTRDSARDIAGLMGCDFREIDIRKMCLEELAAIGHDGVTPDITYENVQARRRTQIAMNLANHTAALQLATGDMSELALGWCTYGGDQIGMYNVNGGVPKTLLQRVVQWYAANWAEEALRDELLRVLDTPISPELRPMQGEAVQSTEGTLGPYELHDFFLYHLLAGGADREKLLFLALRAFAGRHEPELIEGTLSTFLRRFYASQFKRATAPEGPAALEISLSPSGLVLPSDLPGI